MWNEELISTFLEESGRYPHEEGAAGGLSLSLDEQGRLLLCGGAADLIDLADLLVSLSLSGENRGQHWHVDNLTLLARDSQLSELILLRK